MNGCIVVYHHTGKTCPNIESQYFRKSPNMHMDNMKANGKIHEIQDQECTQVKVHFVLLLDHFTVYSACFQ